MWSPGSLRLETERGYCSKVTWPLPGALWTSGGLQFPAGGFEVPSRHTELPFLLCQQGWVLGLGVFTVRKENQPLLNDFFFHVGHSSENITISYFSTYPTHEVDAVII